MLQRKQWNSISCDPSPDQKIICSLVSRMKVIRISTIRDHMMPAIGRRGHGRVRGMTDAASNAQHKYCAILFLVAISSDIFCISTNGFLFPRSVDGTNDKSCLGGDVYRFSLHCGSMIGGGWRTFLVCVPKKDPH